MRATPVETQHRTLQALIHEASSYNDAQTVEVLKEIGREQISQTERVFNRIGDVHAIDELPTTKVPSTKSD